MATVKRWKNLKQALLRCLFFLFLGLGVIFGYTGLSSAGVQIALQPKVWPPDGERIVCPVIRDNWVSAVADETEGNNGGAKRLKVKGQQEFTLIDIDPAPLQGKLISGALLHLRSASPIKAPLMRIGVSSVASHWVEGSSNRYGKQFGSSSFSQAKYRVRDWAYKGSNLLDVVFGKGHTLWKFSDATLPDENRWQTVAVDPDVVAARLAGLSSGFLIYDEVGNEWSCRKNQFRYQYFPNRFFFSRESGVSAPWLEVWTDGSDTSPPGSISNILVNTTDLPAGEALLSWETPADRGGGRTLGFNISYRREGREVPFPRYLIPMAGAAGEKVKMHIRDLTFGAGEVIDLVIKPVDNTGNIGAASAKKIRFSSGRKMPVMTDPHVHMFNSTADVLRIKNMSVSVVDLLDKIDPDSGEMIPPQKWGYKSGNHLFNSDKKRIRLHAARNEMVAFQLNLTEPSNPIHIEYQYPHDSKLKPKIFRFGYVPVVNMRRGGKSLLPDPLLPCGNPCEIPAMTDTIRDSGQQYNSLMCEVYIPHDEPAGKKEGRLILSTGDETLSIDVDLTVWNFTLPNKLSFVPEMNAYGTVHPYKGYEYYRLAHEHRTCINRLPYNWGGIPSFAPPWNGRKFSWDEWDREVGPLLDGSAFNDLPRKGEPVDVFYLPFNENWPVSLFDHYRPSYWANEAFAQSYEDKLKSGFQEFASHIAQKGWNDPVFQFYLNNKIYYRKKYKKSSAPWIFDEPVNTQDFWALHWYGKLWKETVAPFQDDLKMWFRGDVSYSQYSRDMLWGIMDVVYFGGSNAQKTRMKQDEQILFGKSYFAEYGSPNKIGEPNTQPVLWCLSAWAKGAMGVLPWQTIGSKNSWKRGEQTALFYPHADGPFPSVRLKAFTQGQQMVEYLTLLSGTYDLPRYAVAEWLRKRLQLNEKVKKVSSNDAGTARFSDVTPLDIWKLKMSIGEMLSKKAPPYKRSLVDWKTPVWAPDRLPDIGYVSPAPEVDSAKPDCEDFKPQ